MQIIVDTNVLVRMGFMLTATVFTELPDGYVVCTLESLINEFKHKNELIGKFPSGFPEDYMEELEKIKLNLSKGERKLIKTNIYNFAQATQDQVNNEREREGKSKSSLSKADLEVLFTAYTLNLSLATDEDPMTRAFRYINESDDLKVFSTLTLIKLFESLEVIDESQRKRCIKKLLDDATEFMPKGWIQEYKEIFSTGSVP